MREQTIVMCCFLDNLLPHIRPVTARKPHTGRRPNDAQVLTRALVAARYFGGNLVLGQRYLEQHWSQARLDKSSFCRRLHALADTLAALFAAFGHALKRLHTEARYIIDSFPVAVCHNTRIPRCKLLPNSTYHGRCASKRS